MLQKINSGNTKILRNTTIFSIKKKHFRMISEGLDTEGWRNGCSRKKIFKIYKHRKPLLFHNITIFTVFFDQINATLVSIRVFIQKNKNKRLSKISH